MGDPLLLNGIASASANCNGKEYPSNQIPSLFGNFRITSRALG
jgi:hypothetical protein